MGARRRTGCQSGGSGAAAQTLGRSDRSSLTAAYSRPPGRPEVRAGGQLTTKTSKRHQRELSAPATHFPKLANGGAKMLGVMASMAVPGMENACTACLSGAGSAPPVPDRYQFGRSSQWSGICARNLNKRNLTSSIRPRTTALLPAASPRSMCRACPRNNDQPEK